MNDTVEIGPKTVLFVKDDTDGTIALARSHPGIVVATRYAVDAVLRKQGLAPQNPSTIFNEGDKSAQLEHTLTYFRCFLTYLETLGLTCEENALIQLKGLALIAQSILFRSVSETLGAQGCLLALRGKGEPYSIERAFPSSSPENVTSALERPGKGSHFGELRYVPGSWTLDLRSEIARNSEVEADNLLRLLPPKHGKATSHIRFSNLKKVIRALLGSRPRVIGYRLQEAAVPIELAQTVSAIGNPVSGFENWPALAKALGQLARALLLDTRQMEQVMENIADALGPRLKGAQLNFATSPITTAAITVCNRRSIPTQMGSHGNIVVHGSPTRRAVANVLAECGYNTFPNLTYTVPRSRYQVPGNPARAIIRRPRAKPMVECSPVLAKGRPFHILLAPNFLIWPRAIPAITTSCFECMETIEYITRAVAGHENFSLDIRVKTTVRDVAQKASQEGERGVVPDNVSHLFELADNIGDSNLGSYREAIQKADLVVTEGMTSVIYDAVEMRRPILLLNVHRDRVPATPAAGLADIEEAPDIRHPIYKASCDEDLLPLLERLRTTHDKTPLTDAEIAPVTWQEEG